VNGTRKIQLIEELTSALKETPIFLELSLSNGQVAVWAQEPVCTLWRRENLSPPRNVLPLAQKIYRTSTAH
jgi:hypothetical protein